MRAKKAILLTLGVLIGLIGMALTAGGGVLTWANATQREDGYITSSIKRFQTDAYALASGDMDLRLWPGPGSWIPDLGDVAVRIRVADPGGGPVFVGVAPAADVAGYLDGVGYSVITDPGEGPFGPSYRGERGVRYREEAGGPPATPPGEQPFWAASTSGTGLRTLNWTVRDGEWTIVVMAADASSGVSVDASVGVKAGFLLPLGLGLLFGGLIILALGTMMVVAGARVEPSRRRDEDEGEPAPAEEKATTGA